MTSRLYELMMALMPAVLLCGPTSSAAAEPLPGKDQFQQSESGDIIFFADHPIAQTFTSGITGQLTQVDVWLGSYGSTNEDITFQVIETVDGVPSGPVLESLIGSNLPNGWNTFDLSAAQVMLEEGTQYAIVLSDADPSGGDPSRMALVRWRDSYPGGALWNQSNGNWLPTTVNIGGPTPGDMAFRTWMVAVPEPGMLMGPLALLLMAGRRSR